MEDDMEDNTNRANENMTSINEEILEAADAENTGPNEVRFASRFGDNLNAATRAALLSTILEDTTMTVGGILDALRGDDFGPVMEMFCAMTIADLLDATGKSSRIVDASDEDEYDEDDSEDDSEDDDEEGDDEPLDSDDDDDDGPLYAQRAKTSSPSFDYKEAEGDDEADDESDDEEDLRPAAVARAPRKSAPTSLKEVEVSVLAALRSGGHRDEDNAIGAEHLYAEMGIDKSDVQAKDEVKAALKALKQSERIDSCGKARGTKYFVS